MSCEIFSLSYCYEAKNEAIPRLIDSYRVVSGTNKYCPYYSMTCPYMEAFRHQNQDTFHRHSNNR